MKPVKFTDLHRYPHGWTKAAETDIKKTFEKVRADLEAQRNRNVLKLNEAIDRRKKR